MDSSCVSSYEPYNPRRVQELDEDHAEKPLIRDSGDQRFGMQPSPRSRSPRASFKHFRMASRVVALLCALIILAMQAHSGYIWLSTRHNYIHNARTGLRTREWATLDIWTTWVMLLAAVIASVIHLIALITHCSCVRLAPILT